jgi:hypothetical protein
MSREGVKSKNVRHSVKSEGEMGYILKMSLEEVQGHERGQGVQEMEGSEVNGRIHG